jgi:FAD/FMN-containing dehydrogenase
MSRALRVLAEHRQPVAVQGGLTGLAGGATPQADEVALSLSRVNAIESFDPMGGTLSALEVFGDISSACASTSR